MHQALRLYSILVNKYLHTAKQFSIIFPSFSIEISSRIRRLSVSVRFFPLAGCLITSESSHLMANDRLV